MRHFHAGIVSDAPFVIEWWTRIQVLGHVKARMARPNVRWKSLFASLMDFQGSSHQKRWIFTPESLEKCRERANLGLPPSSHAMDLDHPQEATNGTTERLTVEEEKALVKRYTRTIVVAFGKWLEELNGPGHGATNLVVKWTAATFFRRYYVYHTMADISPKEIMLGCMLLAAKCEECRTVTPKAIYAWRDKNYTIQQIVESESTVAAGVTFDLHVFSPHTALTGIFALLSSKCNELTKLTSPTAEEAPLVALAQTTMKLLQEDKVKLEIFEQLEILMYSDALFLFAPAKLALAAAAKGALKESIEKLLNRHSEEAIQPFFVKSVVSAEEGKILDAKLERVRNPLYNRDSEVFKQRQKQKEEERMRKEAEKMQRQAAKDQDRLNALGITPITVKTETSSDE